MVTNEKQSKPELTNSYIFPQNRQTFTDYRALTKIGLSTYIVQLRELKVACHKNLSDFSFCKCFFKTDKVGLIIGH